MRYSDSASLGLISNGSLYAWQVNAGIAKLTVGMPEDDAAIVPVVSKSSADFIEGLVKDAEAKGATLCQEYKREGNLIWPLLIDKVSGARATGGDCQLVPHAA